MARRVSNPRGSYLPQLSAGIEDRVEYMRSSYPNVGQAKLDALKTGTPLYITAPDVWSALFAIDPNDAAAFRQQHHGPWPFHAEPLFRYDPTTGYLAPCDEEGAA